MLKERKTGPILLLLVGLMAEKQGGRLAGWQVGKQNMGGFQNF